MYCDLVRNVREAFEECELVRINCQGVNGSDYRRIGAKLKVCEIFLCYITFLFNQSSKRLKMFPIIFLTAGSCPMCAYII